MLQPQSPNGSPAPSIASTIFLLLLSTFFLGGKYYGAPEEQYKQSGTIEGLSLLNEIERMKDKCRTDAGKEENAYVQTGGGSTNQLSKQISYV